MTKSYLDMFGKILMTRIRDKSIRDWDMIIGGEMKGNRALRVRSQLECFNREQIDILLDIMPQIVDTVLHHLLWSIEQNEYIDILLEGEDGDQSRIRDISDGLSGELYGKNGWIRKYSKERYAEL